MQQLSESEQISWILSFPREMKLGLLKDALDQDNFGVFFQLSKILLDAPISKGGIETEAIEAIRQAHSKSKI